MQMFIANKDKFKKGELKELEESIRLALKNAAALRFYIRAIEEENDREVIKIFIEAIEDMLPGVKDEIRNRDNLFKNISGKCIELGLV